MKKVLAVSGGVDSMVMLDIFLRNYPPEELVVATFDHGTRESSKTDADFVEQKVREFSELASAPRILFYRGRTELGAGISEEKARAARYDFLRKIAFRERGEIFTAHHLDDLIETTAINLIRGTGFRGLAGLSSLGIRRPFIDGFFEEIYDKKKILEYAAKNKIIFREDPTNSSDDYLRNRIREKTRELPLSEKLEVYRLWKKQKAILKEISEILESILPEDRKYRREWFENLDEKVSLEILREGLIRAGISATRPQILEFLSAIKTYLPGKKFNLPGDKLIKLEKEKFQF